MGREWRPALLQTKTKTMADLNNVGGIWFVDSVTTYSAATKTEKAVYDALRQLNHTLQDANGIRAMKSLAENIQADLVKENKRLKPRSVVFEMFFLRDDTCWLSVGDSAVKVTFVKVVDYHW